MLWAVESLCNMKQRNVQTETLLHPVRFPEVQHIVESINKPTSSAGFLVSVSCFSFKK
ncbi:unnamed protein product [Brassica napus]|uniref:(rape) hypothetical protein n=1 Tax=Brassica napus TaxID=3708 RepID=A0A817AMP5_BRANA|nr:unnamed protein product [Brassica napus]